MTQRWKKKTTFEDKKNVKFQPKIMKPNRINKNVNAMLILSLLYRYQIFVNCVCSKQSVFTKLEHVTSWTII